MSDDVMVRVENVSVRYDKQVVLEAVSFDVADRHVIDAHHHILTHGFPRSCLPRSSHAPSTASRAILRSAPWVIANDVNVIAACLMSRACSDLRIDGGAAETNVPSPRRTSRSPAETRAW